MDIVVEINTNMAHVLNKPVVGQGGFQNLLRRLQSGYNPQTGLLVLTQADHDRIVTAIDKYGQGGWQDRLVAIFF